MNSKRRFAVVTDSTADLPDEWRARYGIEVVPLKVLFGNETFRDGIDLTNDQFFERLETAQQLPTTSAPSPGDFSMVYEALSKECDGVVSIHLGSNLSATCEAARLGAEDRDLKLLTEAIGREFPGLEVEVQDGGQQLYPFILSVE